MTLNERMRKARKARKLSQAETGALIGINDSAVSHIEKGHNTPSERTIMLFCSKMGISEKWLRTGEGEMYAPFEQESDEFIKLLAKEYDLDMGGIALVKAVAHMYAELDEPQRMVILYELHAALDAALANPDECKENPGASSGDAD